MGTKDMKVGFFIRLVSLEPGIRKLVMAGRVMDLGDKGNNLYYEHGTEKD